MTRTKDHNIDMNNQILRNKNASKVHNRNSYDYIANDKNILKGISPRNSIIELFHNFCY